MNNPLLKDHYLNGFIVKECGIPESTQKWNVSNRDFNAMLASWTLGCDSVYIRSPRGEKDYSLSIETGDVIWVSDVVRNLCNAACVNGEFVCTGWYVHNKKDGNIICDLRSSIGLEVVRSQIIFPFKTGILCRVSGESGCIVYFDFDDLHVEYFPFNLNLFRVTEDQKYILGWFGCEMRCFDANSKDLIWRCGVQENANGEPISLGGLSVHEDKAYMQINTDTLACHSIIDGQRIWTKKIDSIATSLVCGQGVLVVNRFVSIGGRVEVIDGNTGNYMWHCDVRNPRPSIAGNILIVIHGEDDECMEMRDLFSGVKLWEISSPLTAMVKLLAWGNKLVVSNTLGTFRCYEWSEPYNSSYIK